MRKLFMLQEGVMANRYREGQRTIEDVFYIPAGEKVYIEDIFYDNKNKTILTHIHFVRYDPENVDAYLTPEQFSRYLPSDEQYHSLKDLISTEKEKKNEYYVYIFKTERSGEVICCERLTTITKGEVYYVGKGVFDRAYTGKRNEDTELFAELFCKEVEIIYDGLSEAEAMVFETQLIENFLKNGHLLTNKKDNKPLAFYECLKQKGVDISIEHALFDQHRYRKVN